MSLTLKRVMALSAGLAMAASMAACSSSKEAAPAESAGDDKAAAEDISVTFIQGVVGDPFYVSMQCGVEAKAKELGIKVETQGPQKWDVTLQNPIVQAVTSAKPSGLLIAPNDVTASQKPLEQAAEAGIKVGLVDTTVDDPSFAVTAVASDNEGGGAAAFEAIQKLAPEGGKVMVISNEPGISTTDARTKGFEEAVKKDPKFTYVGVEYAKNDTARAAQIVMAAIQRDPDLVGIFAGNTYAGEGAATGIRQANMQDKIKVVSFDAGPDNVKALKSGAVQALIAQQPYEIGAQALEQVVNVLRGKEAKKTIQTGSTIITADMLGTPEGDKAVYQQSCS